MDFGIFEKRLFMRTHDHKHWYAFSSGEVINMLHTSVEHGLGDGEVNKRRETFGANVLTQKKGENPLIIFLRQFHQPLIYILLAAAIGVGLLKEYVDMIVILSIVIINAIIAFIQEAKALKAIEALSKGLQTESTVVRNNEKIKLNATELVPGDIIYLQSGDKIPADLRLISIRDLKVDESTLTGESLPVDKQTDPLPQHTGLGDQSNMGFSSTLVTYGTGVGVVVNTGDNTEIGKINEMIGSADILATPLTKKIAKFSHLLLWIILSLAGLTLVAGILRNYPLNETFMEAVALAVGAIPEGLPAVVTITLAIGVSRMAKRKAIIRKLPAVETLGSTTVICSDKTGTLTQNEMTVQSIYLGDQKVNVSGVGYEPEGKFYISEEVIGTGQYPGLKDLIASAVLCNDSEINKEGEIWKVEGDPTEGALITAGIKAGLDRKEIERIFRRVDSIPFESQYQYMATLNADADGKRMHVKGSVEKIMPKCKSAQDIHGKIIELDSSKVFRVVDEMASQGLRVLAFASKKYASDKETISHEDVNEGLTFLGLQAMIDPPRPEAIEAVAACFQAGVNVKMITGDHVGTASAIADKLGLNPEEKADVSITGREMKTLPKAEFRNAAEQRSVFARVEPAQKLELVKALQESGHVVAMTGDGVNDAPALRQADIGIAMGITGTEVTKESSDMVLTDDNFASIEAAVEEGRGVFDNLLKFITWTLPTNVSEGSIILIAAFLGIALPILPLQILWINMTTAIFLGAMLAFENKEPGIMERPPRPPKIPLLTKKMAFRIGWVSAILVAGAYAAFELVLLRGGEIEVARTAAVNIIVFGELFYLFACRSLKYSMFKIGFFTNRWLLLGAVAMTLLQIGFTYLPFMNQVFKTAPLKLSSWIVITGVGFLVYGLTELEKSIRRWREDKVLE